MTEIVDRQPERDTPMEPKKVLVLHVEIPDVSADDLPESAGIWADGGEPTPQDYLDVVLEEWMRRDVGITIVTIPGEKCMNDDFEVHAYTGHIVGAEAREPGTTLLVANLPSDDPADYTCSYPLDEGGECGKTVAEFDTKTGDPLCAEHIAWLRGFRRA